jgi:DNA-binding IclR family transcriptional regulator
MQQLFRSTGEPVFLLVLRGDEAVCVELLNRLAAAADE